ncbi:hypothetical protein P0F65_06475 [Sphingomonas sp. I4]
MRVGTGLGDPVPQGGRWRVSLALGLVLLFILLILASGSRAGLALGALGVVFGGALAQARLRRTLRGKPRWVLPVVLAVAAGLMVSSVALSVAADRAVSVNRLLMVDAESDMRGRALPTVIAMIRTYFPVGSGLGGFDPCSACTNRSRSSSPPISTMRTMTGWKSRSTRACPALRYCWLRPSGGARPACARGDRQQEASRPGWDRQYFCS